MHTILQVGRLKDFVTPSTNIEAEKLSCGVLSQNTPGTIKLHCLCNTYSQQLSSRAGRILIKLILRMLLCCNL